MSDPLPAIGLAPPIMHIEQIGLNQLNWALVRWQHRMGEWKRPDYGSARFHGMFHHNRLVAVTATDRLIAAQTCGLNRDEALELGRVCAERPDLCRAMLRLWREFIFPAYGKPWAISYQDAVIHSGNLYRFDGWVKLGTSSSGTDARSGARGRRKVIWGWCALPDLRAERLVA